MHTSLDKYPGTLKEGAGSYDMCTQVWTDTISLKKHQQMWETLYFLLLSAYLTLLSVSHFYIM